MLRLLSLLLAGSLFMASCISHPSTIQPKLNQQDSFTTYPKITDSIDFLFNERQLFNLPSLKNGTDDSLEIRIWPLQELTYSVRVYIFRISKTGERFGWNYYTDQDLLDMGNGTFKNIDGE